MKLYEAKHLEQDTLKRIRSGIEEWDRFLKSAAHVYRYSFADQVMIYAQKPEATACASMNIWNTNMGCWIQRGQKGIALIDRNDTRKLKYVWDVSSVAVRAGGHKPKLWDIKEYHNDAVISQLSDTYGYGEASNSINDVLRVIVDNVSDEYSKELADDIYPVDESLAAKAENMDSRHGTFRIAVREFFVHSIEIMVNERMGYDVLDVTQHDLSFEKSLSELMFMQVADSMSEASCELLRQIGAVVLNYDKKQTDQSIDKVPKQEYTALKRKSIKVEGDEYGTGLHAEWGLSDTEHSTEPAVERTAGTNGETAQEVAGNKTSRKLHSVADAGHTGRYMSGGGTQSRGGDRPSYGEDDEGRERNGRTQAAGSDGVGQTSQQHQSQSRGDSSGYDSIHPVVEIVPESGTLPVFPSEEEQKEIIDNSLKEAETPASFFVAIESTNDFLDPKAGFTGYTGKKYRLVTTGDTGFLKAYPDESTMFSSERECQEYATEQGLTIINYDDMVFSSWKKKLEYEIAHEDTKEAVKNPSKRDKAHYNIQAIKMMKLIESENRLAFEDEKDVLRKYSGWGGIPEVFDENDPKWIEENKQLKRILSPEEYDMARSSTLNAHYTDPEIIEAMYTALKDMGFENGNILEPSMGIGNFFEAMPKSMAEDSRLYGVELDSITGRMAKLIYPEAHIEVRGYENTDFQNDFFDVAIGNVPFGQYKVLDKEYDSNNFLIHDYFFAKTIDKVRPGGIIAFITSKGTMDKQNSSVRRYISKRAELVGAVRLPNTAFKNAGTSVTSDIIFLKKRNALTDVTDPWVELAVDDNGIEYNSYFVDHPEMVLGSMQMVSGPHGPESTCVPESGTPLKEQIKKAISTFQAVYELDQIELPDDELFIPATIPAMPGIRNYSYSNVGNKIYYRENSVMIEKDISDRAAERITGLINIRESVGRLIDLQLEDAPDEEIIAARDRLNKTYDSFVKRCGYINTRTNKSLFRDDSSYSLLASLEDLDDNGNVIGKADMFTKRTIRKAQPVDHVDTSVDALAVSMGELGKVDLSYMSRLTGKTENDIVKDLEGIIFEEPVSHEWQTEEEYLSGNIRNKLKEAEAAAKQDGKYQINVESLKNVMPKPLEAADIEVRLGATWIKPQYIEDFMREVLKTPVSLFKYGTVKVNFAEMTDEWNIQGKRSDNGNPLVYSTYGTERIGAYSILENSLNLKDVRVYDSVFEDGKEKRILNKKETMLAQQKQDALKVAFTDWVFKDPDRRKDLTDIYNRLYNSVRPREYDGSNIIFNGMSPEITLAKHQKNAVAHVLYGNNTLLAHCVGAGKTFEMIAAAMESKRLGLCHKSLFVVPNHLTEQWAGDFMRLYPGANILAATKKDFEPARRKRFCARIATGDYDAVIIGHTQFEKIPLSAERQKRVIAAQIESITDAIRNAKANNGEYYTIKAMEKTKKSLEVRLGKLNDRSKKDDVVTFEQLGVDRLFVDESQEFKNLFLYTKMRNVAGISQSESQRASDMFAKCRYMDEITGGKGITFATGTPISNSMTELYTNMRYLQYDRLMELGFKNFDAWASTFGETKTAIELTPEGTGYRAKTRFSKFYNLPELISIFKEAADIQTADMLHLPVPECDYENVVIQPSEFQKQIVKSLGQRAEYVRNASVDPAVDNMLKITNDGRKCALDQKLINPDLPENPNSKVKVCAVKAYEMWKDTEDIKAAQLVFCDSSTPKGDGSYNVYDALKGELVKLGVPEKEIAYIHDANSENKKAELFAKVRSGQIRFLFGSTKKMGAGTNVQERLIALHHLDVPWRPSDIEQQEGRILRQGNINPRVKIFRYVTESTFDSYSWQIIENKQKFIGQIMTSKLPVRSCDDVDEAALSYAEVKALATGNPYIKEKMTLDTEVAKLKLLKANFKSQKYRLEDDIVSVYPQEISQLKDNISGYKADIAKRDTTRNIIAENFFITINGVSYHDRKSGGAALIEAAHNKDTNRVRIGSYMGFDLYSRYNFMYNGYELYIQGKKEHWVELSKDPVGVITRINNCLDGLDKKLEKAQSSLSDVYQKLESAKIEAAKEFDKEDELNQKLERLSELNALLDMDEKREEKEKQRKENEAIKQNKEISVHL